MSEVAALTEDLIKALGVKHAFVCGKYTIETITKSDIEQVQKYAFELYAGGNLKSKYLTSGIAVAAICLTGYFLEKKYGLMSRVLGLGSVIYEVSFPVANSETFEKLVKTGALEDELKKMFEHLEESLRELGSEDVLTELHCSEEFAELKKVRLDSFQFVDLEYVQTHLKDLQESKIEPKHQVPQHQIPQPPKGLRLAENSQSPSTSILVYYQQPDENVENYVITVRNLMNDADLKRIETTDEYCVVTGLEPRQSYFVWVQSQHNGVLSKKVMVQQPIETVPFDPRPWRGALDLESESGYKTQSEVLSELQIPNQSEDGGVETAPAEPKHDLWNTDLPKELSRIYPASFRDVRLKRLLFKFDELGVAEAKDLKYFKSKDVAELLKESLKPIEILKLMDYASDYGSSEVKHQSPFNLHIDKFCGGSLVANSNLTEQSRIGTTEQINLSN